MKVPAPGGRVDLLLEELWNAGGTDLLLTVGMAPQLRVHGVLRPVADRTVLTRTDTDTLLAEMLNPHRANVHQTTYEQDFSFSWRQNARIRANAFTQRGDTAIALRIIPRSIPTVSELGLPEIVGKFAQLHQGLVLVTGPTGSGKSTTLASVIHQINTDRACHIITIEDPIEYVHEHRRSAVNQREVGSDTASFPDALRAALREDPDVLLVGEMRDLESIRFALTIAETGHLVFATLHTNDTAQSLARIIDVFPAEQQCQVRVQLSAALSGVVYQRLVPRTSGGLVAAFEVMVANAGIRNLIKEGKTHQLRNALVTGRREGMITLEQSLSALLQAGEISYADAVSRCAHPKELEVRPRTGAGTRP
ncbi:type IV pilus twitching motility protein PilT [Kribbella sp. CA-293567]|uniref:type IV pilus twitching motility protein PilT n=1 Tax=Kribbella sp. CA-293567 TaxID=3002436 RepID=UPI0022DCF709|nr:PilT/PilU family type 4a pilus ATPase [Kribbella sp. CA-293567]WBQ07090.1 PilT/PilU family type 4a pilus ATPase [Kribbella sp. CA-293567]